MAAIATLILNDATAARTFIPKAAYAGPEAPAVWEYARGTNRLDVVRLELHATESTGNTRLVGYKIVCPTVVVDPVKGPVVTSRQVYDSTKGGRGFAIANNASVSEVNDIIAFAKNFAASAVLASAVSGDMPF